MDELTLFAEIAPPPPGEAAEMCARARARLDDVITGAGASTGAGYRKPPRHRRRPFAFALAGGGLVAAGAAAAAVTLLAGNAAHPGTSLRSFVTAAYTVRPDQDGTITVGIKQLQDPASLQRALTADGVPALVRYVPARTVSGTYHGTTYYGISPVCQYLNLPQVPNSQFRMVGPAHGSADSVFWIRPSALPKGSIVFIQDGGGGPSIDVLTSGKLPQCVPVKPPSPQQIVLPQGKPSKQYSERILKDGRIVTSS